MNKKIIMQNGKVITAKGFGSSKKIITELVFNTSMVGYQEILTDNSYCNQGVIMTYPLIGNYGINDTSNESVQPFIDALIVKEKCDFPSHYQNTETLDEYLKRFDIVGIYDIDTRYLTQILRDEGSQLAMIVDIDYNEDDAMKEILSYVAPTNQVQKVSTQKPYTYENTGYKLVVIDCGVKLNILRSLTKLGFNIVVLPYNASEKEVMSYNPDALFLSNGPGDPTDAKEVIKLVKSMQGKIPIFGICLGHQIIGIANDCEIQKMKFGHRGANHPVKNLETNKVEITSQNHSYTITKVNEKDLEITHINLLDNTCEGIRHKKYPVFSVQYHPESTPGPEDSFYLFEQFKKIVKQFKGE